MWQLQKPTAVCLVTWQRTTAQKAVNVWWKIQAFCCYNCNVGKIECHKCNLILWETIITSVKKSNKVKQMKMAWKQLRHFFSPIFCFTTFHSHHAISVILNKTSASADMYCCPSFLRKSLLKFNRIKIEAHRGYFLQCVFWFINLWESPWPVTEAEIPDTGQCV